MSIFQEVTLNNINNLRCLLCSAKPLFTGSNPVAASIDLKGLDILTETLSNKFICSYFLAATWLPPLLKKRHSSNSSEEFH